MMLPLEKLVPALLSEAFHSRRLVVAVFVGICITTVFVGLSFPKHYAASTTILVDEKNILQPLMQGAAVATEVTDRARLARDVIFGRKIMNQVLEVGGWIADDKTEAEKERVIEGIMGRTTISNAGRNIIAIQYADSSAERAFKVTQQLANLFISETLGAKAAESQAAFEFIDKQSQEYHDKLARAEEALKEFRSANLDANPGSDGDIGARLSGLQTRIDQSIQELKEAEIKKTSLEKQLTGEAESSVVLSREGQYRARVAELQGQLETLRLSYHDTYPDIVRLRHQIADLNEEIARERTRRAAHPGGVRTEIDESVINNPMYQQLRRELSQTQVQIDTLRARIADSRKQFAEAIDRGKRVQSGEVTLAELTREYQVNREIFQDLLKRRENARVSMNLDKERQGLTFRIQEPARVPQTPDGLRFGHIILGGLVMGLLLPFGILFARLQFDPRFRVGSLIALRAKVVPIASVPRLATPVELAATWREMQVLALAVGTTVLAVVLVAVVHVAGGA